MMTDKRITDKDKYELTIEETSFVEDVRNYIYSQGTYL